MGSGDSSQILVPVRHHLTGKVTSLGPLKSLCTLEIWFQSHTLGACWERASAFVLHREVSHLKTLLCSLNLYFSLWSVPRQCGLLCKKLAVHMLGFGAFLLCWLAPESQLHSVCFCLLLFCQHAFEEEMQTWALIRHLPRCRLTLIVNSAGWHRYWGEASRLSAAYKATGSCTKWHRTDQSAEMEVCRAHMLYFSKRRGWVSASPLLIVPETMVNSANCQGSVGTKVGQFPGKVSRFVGNWFWKR